LEVRLEALRGRNREAWSAVYRDHADRVYQYALYRVRGDRESASDVVQEVFVRAIEGIGTFRGGEDRLVSWLRGICRRVLARRAREAARGKGNRHTLGSGNDEAGNDEKTAEGRMVTGTGWKSGGGTEAVDPNPRADEALARKEEQRLTAAALTALPPRWEKALRWKYCDDVAVREIGERLGISEKAAESVLSRAREAFRAMYVRILNHPNGRMHEVEDWPDDR
jgi:RNA polymerase sigma-70 factor (ECF subfamily)